MTPFLNGVILGQGTNADIDTAEEDIVVIQNDLELVRPTQVSVHITDLSLGTNTSLELRFYFQYEKGGSFLPRVKQNTSDNTLDDFPAIIDGSTPNSGKIVYEFPMPACFGMKVTGKGAGGANSSVTAKVLGRYN